MWEPVRREVEDQNSGLTLDLTNPTGTQAQMTPFLGGDFVPPLRALSAPGEEGMAFFQYDHINDWLLDDPNLPGP
jgi:hypothetical protein